MTATLPVRERLKNFLHPLIPLSVRSVLKVFWARYSYAAYKPRTVRHRYGPYEFLIEIVCYDGETWFNRDWEDGEVAEIALLKQHKLAAGATVFNIGANQCLQAMMMAREVGPSGSVWAVEPNGHNVRAGLRNCELNGIRNCRIREAAVSSASGRIPFNQSMNGQVALSERQIGAHFVEAITIDEMTAEYGMPDVLYVDVEGFECHVLEGARATLAKSRPDCFVEVHLGMGLEKFGGSSARLLSFFPSKEYRLYCSVPSEGRFWEVSAAEEIPTKRFFLLALARENNVN
jgi:FkbM family methyltransferase